MILLKRFLCAFGWHQWEEAYRRVWQRGDGHPSRWRESGVYDVTFACGCCGSVRTERLYRSKTAKRNFERSRT